MNNWPNRDFFIEIQGVGATSAPGYTEAEHQKLRKAGVAVTAEVDGRIYVGPGALSTAGTSIDANKATADIMKRVRSFAELLNSKPEEVARLLTNAGVVPPAAPDFEFGFLDDG